MPKRADFVAKDLLEFFWNAPSILVKRSCDYPKMQKPCNKHAIQIAAYLQHFSIILVCLFIYLLFVCLFVCVGPGYGIQYGSFCPEGFIGFSLKPKVFGVGNTPSKRLDRPRQTDVRP